MKKLSLVVLSLAILLVVPVVPVLAGDHGKCTHTVEDCLNKMVAKLKSTGFIGVELDSKDKETLTVTKVVQDSPAEKSGIQEGDILYALNGIRFTKKNWEAINKVKQPGKTVTCTIKRHGSSKELNMTLVPMPADLMAKYIGEHMLDHAKDNALAKK